MRQSEFKKKYDPDLGRYTRQHIYGEGVMDVFKSIFWFEDIWKDNEKSRKNSSH